jgi:hypothetical protein
MEMLRGLEFDLSTLKFSSQKPYWGYLVIKIAYGESESTQHNNWQRHPICLLENDT